MTTALIKLAVAMPTIPTRPADRLPSDAPDESNDLKDCRTIFE